MRGGVPIGTYMEVVQGRCTYRDLYMEVVQGRCTYRDLHGGGAGEAYLGTYIGRYTLQKQNCYYNKKMIVS